MEQCNYGSTQNIYEAITSITSFERYSILRDKLLTISNAAQASGESAIIYRSFHALILYLEKIITQYSSSIATMAQKYKESNEQYESVLVKCLIYAKESPFVRNHILLEIQNTSEQLFNTVCQKITQTKKELKLPSRVPLSQIKSSEVSLALTEILKGLEDATQNNDDKSVKPFVVPCEEAPLFVIKTHKESVFTQTEHKEDNEAKQCDMDILRLKSGLQKSNVKIMEMANDSKALHIVIDSMKSKFKASLRSILSEIQKYSLIIEKHLENALDTNYIRGSDNAIR